MASQGLLPAVLSGLLAALSSVLGKLAMARDDSERVCMGSVQAWLGDDREPVEAHYICESALALVRGTLFALMILSNMVMWTVFTRALRLSTATLEVTVVNLAANFFFTAIFGQTLFSEQLTPLWFIGSVFIVFGLALMHIGNLRSEKRQTSLKERRCDRTYPGPEEIYERHKARKYKANVF
ncbi:uncharacterized protein LOC111266777 [Varroa jacobsoni]|uniref:Transmembrane protein 42 n=1 Tax=Varroa destructor TaxID=109461 RepID=A0A7M7KCH3_VARDE|nr:uncharacterized protein LOC111251416 [Varroa destructor]XP_022700271.1 uncharacterized protein LOC111266777 [Varroa jacobsoni]